MEISGTAGGFTADPCGRVGIAEVVRSYGIDKVRTRIEQLRGAGMHYAAAAIERELLDARLVEPPARRTRCERQQAVLVHR
ncbi:hypothetical protein [Nocardia mangyaensis]|uniref:hypothetical protein n=1 Tax=Nocardia mangyaensis TaxID=2213200 RepID=UPI002676F947|nr:hypothetical protein [Nocardia mangyaensis]MDO3647761.1 hypothetical protein [Nocardia mangyaensis]